jgi:hypothetical protein
VRVVGFQRLTGFSGCAVELANDTDARISDEMGHSRHFDRARLTSGLPQLAYLLSVRRQVSNVS